jgi:hypothetical protein
MSSVLAAADRSAQDLSYGLIVANRFVLHAPHVALASAPLSGGERRSLVCNADRIGTAPRVPDILRYPP